jgi:hypothetical protein
MAAAPLTWDEVEEAAASDDAAGALLPVTVAGVLDRLDRHGDLFAGALECRQSLPEP